MIRPGARVPSRDDVPLLIRTALGLLFGARVPDPAPTIYAVGIVWALAAEQIEETAEDVRDAAGKVAETVTGLRVWMRGES